MSDPALVLTPALDAWIRSWPAVTAAFGAKQVKVFTVLPPVNVTKPYVIIAGMPVDDVLSECLDAVEIDLQVDVWSLTSPPGFAEAHAIAPAVKDAVVATAEGGNSPAFAISGYRVVSAVPVSTIYLTDPSDGKTVHAVIRVLLAIDPV